MTFLTCRIGPVSDPERLAALARAWDEAVDGYERYFVPRFAPWVDLAVRAITETGLPDGPVLVPCCGTFPELPALTASLPRREIVGIDLSPGMVRLARQRAAGWPRVRVEERDAATLAPGWSNACAAVVSAFGLQQLPDPAAALHSWAAALRPGGRLSVVFWPGSVEQHGPFALLDRVLSGHRAPGDGSWQDRLGDAVATAGAVVERDEDRSFPMSHPDAGAFWEAMTTGGPLRALANARGPEFMRARRQEFLHLAPAGPWHHSPQARHIVGLVG
jgi:SAM-dependent methyltransferase